MTTPLTDLLCDHQVTIENSSGGWSDIIRHSDIRHVFHPLLPGSKPIPPTDFLVQLPNGRITDICNLFEPVASGKETPLPTGITVNGTDLQKLFCALNTIPTGAELVQLKSGVFDCDTHVMIHRDTSGSMNGVWPYLNPAITTLQSWFAVSYGTSNIAVSDSSNEQTFVWISQDAGNWKNEVHITYINESDSGGFDPGGHGTALYKQKWRTATAAGGHRHAAVMGVVPAGGRYARDILNHIKAHNLLDYGVSSFFDWSSNTPTSVHIKTISEWLNIPTKPKDISTITAHAVDSNQYDYKVSWNINSTVCGRTATPVGNGYSLTMTGWQYNLYRVDSTGKEIFHSQKTSVNRLNTITFTGLGNYTDTKWGLIVIARGAHGYSNRYSSKYYCWKLKPPKIYMNVSTSTSVKSFTRSDRYHSSNLDSQSGHGNIRFFRSSEGWLTFKNDIKDMFGYYDRSMIPKIQIGYGPTYVDPANYDRLPCSEDPFDGSLKLVVRDCCEMDDPGADWTFFKKKRTYRGSTKGPLLAKYYTEETYPHYWRSHAWFDARSYYKVSPRHHWEGWGPALGFPDGVATFSMSYFSVQFPHYYFGGTPYMVYTNPLESVTTPGDHGLLAYGGYQFTGTRHYYRPSAKGADVFSISTQPPQAIPSTWGWWPLFQPSGFEEMRNPRHTQSIGSSSRDPWEASSYNTHGNGRWLPAGSVHAYTVDQNTGYIGESSNPSWGAIISGIDRNPNCNGGGLWKALVRYRIFRARIPYSYIVYESHKTYSVNTSGYRVAKYRVKINGTLDPAFYPIGQQYTFTKIDQPTPSIVVYGYDASNNYLNTLATN